MTKINLVRGTHDLYGKDINSYRFIEKIITNLAKLYDFNEIVTPIFENTEVFKKPLGEYSDVVLKEMYTFEDRNKSSLTLRPEYTTPMIRAAISNNLFSSLPLKLFGMGPMFRRERPQKGRYRQFNQINFEIFGSSDPFLDAEIIILADSFLKKLKLNKKFKLYINSLGDLNTLEEYKRNLSTFYNKFKNDLSNESKDKINTNPLRILDSKIEQDIKINLDSPKIEELYSKSALEKFENIKKFLNTSKVEFEVDKSLVRGLDYYCHTVFEFKTDLLGSQNTIIGGGRYDGLIKKLGGPEIPGVGWASGVERLIMLLDNIKENLPKVQIIIMNEEHKDYALNLITKLRENEISVRFDYKTNLKKSLSNANLSKINFAIIIGEEEKNNNLYTIKNLFENNQQTVNLEKLIHVIKS